MPIGFWYIFIFSEVPVWWTWAELIFALQNIYVCVNILTITWVKVCCPLTVLGLLGITCDLYVTGRNVGWFVWLEDCTWGSFIKCPKCCSFYGPEWDIQERSGQCVSRSRWVFILLFFFLFPTISIRLVYYS